LPTLVVLEHFCLSVFRNMRAQPNQDSSVPKPMEYELKERSNCSDIWAVSGRCLLYLHVMFLPTPRICYFWQM